MTTASLAEWASRIERAIAIATRASDATPEPWGYLRPSGVICASDGSDVAECLHDPDALFIAHAPRGHPRAAAATARRPVRPGRAPGAARGAPSRHPSCQRRAGPAALAGRRAAAPGRCGRGHGGGGGGDPRRCRHPGSRGPRPQGRRLVSGTGASRCGSGRRLPTRASTVRPRPPVLASRRGVVSPLT
jgi:hypothetical protein